MFAIHGALLAVWLVVLIVGTPAVAYLGFTAYAMSLHAPTQSDTPDKE
jgi:hypothetical protein